MRQGMAVLGLVLAGWCASAENLCIEPEWEKGFRKLSGGPTRTNATFNTSFVVPAGHERSRWVFEAERAAGNFIVSVNGARVGEAQAPIFSVPLANIRAGTNQVSFFCSRDYAQMKTLSPETNPFRELRLRNRNRNGRFENYHLGFNGAERIVELSSPGDVRRAWAETSVRRKCLTLHATVDAEKAFTGTLACAIVDADGRTVRTFAKDFTFAAGEQEVSVDHPWADPKLWDVGQGNLYTARVRLLAADGREIDALKPFRFGFRELWTEGRTVMMNGHPLHTRSELWWVPLNDMTVGFFNYLGRNAYYLQPHPNCWWNNWGGETASVSHTVFDFCDERGILTFYSAPQVSYNHELVDESLCPSYLKTTRQWVDIFRNHPSIIAWSVSMNAYNPKQSIVPNLLGRREKPYDRQDSGAARKQLSTRRAAALCKQADPTRLVYAHADGNLGDIGSGNCYPNWTPLQEVEEYPLAWYKDGDMPWFAVEYGVYSGSFYKDKSLLLTEYAAMYFGDQAYDRETEEQLEKTVELGVKAGHHGNNLINEVAKTSSLYWDLIRLTTEGTDKYWRAFGMFGWAHFFGSNYGQPEKWKLTEKTSPDTAPAWANPLVEMHRKNMQDLLVFIGGDEMFTDKTHAFYAGEEVRKNIVFVWDGAQTTNVTARWTLTDDRGAVVAKGSAKTEIGAGRVVQKPIRFAAPSVARRTAYTLTLDVPGIERSRLDDFTLEVFPRQKPSVAFGGKVHLFDPKGKSAWVKRLVPSVRSVTEKVRLSPGDVLIVGREALMENGLLPYAMDDVAKGARVLVLEQNPMVWESFGFRNVDMVSRLIFETPYSREVMDGLRSADLRYWRGSPNLLPEYRHARDVTQPPKGVNRHGVASTVFEIPNVVGFEPLFQCEFDLRYAPLLRYRTGSGCVYYSSLDFTDRVGVDPAATLLAGNVLKRLAQASTPADKMIASSPRAGDILVNDGRLDPGTDAFLKRGGLVLNIALDEADLKARGVKSERRKLWRVKLDGELAQTATRNMFRWRDALEVDCIREPGAACDGVWYRRGNECFLQVSSRLLEGRYKDDAVRARAVMPTILALDLLKGRVLTALGAAPEARVDRKLDSICTAQPYRPLRDWYAYGPFVSTNTTAAMRLSDVFPGEAQAISGDMNPNLTYRVDATWKGFAAGVLAEETRAKTFDFRQRVDANDEGWIDLSRAFGLKGRSAVCYLTHVWEEKTAGEATFSFAFPAKAEVYLNGEKVFTSAFAHDGKGAREMLLNTLPVRLRVKAGENALTVKLATLPEAVVPFAQRMAVTRNLPGVSLEEVLESVSNGDLYNEKGNLNYAYRYFYW